MPRSDEQLVADYRQNRSRDALDELVNRHLSRVYHLTWQMVLHEATAEDLTQEVFLRVFRYLDTYEQRSRFTTWLHRIAVNVVRGHFKSKKLCFQQAESADGPSATPVVEPDEQLEVDDEIEAALARLSPPLRRAVVLLSIQQIDVSEAAEVEGCTPSTMYWRLHEARKRLRGYLQSRGTV